MNITIPQKTAASMFSAASHITSRINTIPILGNVRISVEDGEMILTTTNLDMALEVRSKCEVKSEGEITAPVRALSDIVKKMNAQTGVSLQTDEERNRLVVSGGRSTFRLQTLPADDFPDFADAGDDSITFKIGSKAWSAALKKVEMCISTEETRFYLNGVCLHTEVKKNPLDDAEDKALCFVATDGHKLAYSHVIGDFPDIENIIIPRTTVSEMIRLCSDVDGDVEISISRVKISIKTETIKFVSKLIDGTFPDYKRVVPERINTTIDVDAKTMKEAVDRVAIVASEKGRAVKINVSDVNVVLSVNNPDAGSAEEEIAASYQGPTMNLALNCQYLSAILGAYGDTDVKFHVKEAGSPVLIEQAGNANDYYVIMPMRV